ncbi:hypothetical protein LMG28688_04265 [Paraburkholderia caffeinitolerans]|uniref:Uncharacterized protein n=1 Tax=Paraburkholderia caffeinitolerans TaxID=1723730 RepID=A0A6J5GEN3_9BURK|nr:MULTISPECIES: methylamine utilization protein MauJ [Paraburkholderia]CAB3796238.1 hypothetical protein LMG28688_04265 [Paraburkholderia caffeinitolerans]
MADLLTETTGTTASMPRPSVNDRVTITIVPIFDDRPKASPTGTQGTYEAIFVLGVPGTALFQEALDIPELLKSGDSLLTMPKDSVKVECLIQGDGPVAKISFLPNAENRLAQAEMTFDAASFDAAEEIAWNLISNMLSVWSFRHDTAVDISGYQIRETASQVLRANFGIVGAPKTLDINFGGPSTAERRALLAAYREGINATNPFYQFLSLFKVVEGVHKLRTHRRKTQKNKGAGTSEAVERFPADVSAFPEGLSSFAARLSGKRYNAVIDDMRATVRNALAHLNPLDSHLMADKYSDVKRCLGHIPPLRYIARQMLLAELQTPIL